MSSQTRHKHRTLIRYVPQATVWKAIPKRGLRSPFAYRGLKARQDVRWRQVDPFEGYRSGGHRREPNAGPHADFLRLKAMLDAKGGNFRDAADVFATNYGLLGLFHLEYSAPVLPEGKVLISPEATVEKNGQLRLVNPASEGLRLLARMQNEHQPPTWKPFTEEYYDAIAMPNEISFVRRDLLRAREEFAPTRDGYVSWSEARSHYDALVVLDPTQVWDTGVSVLVRKENLLVWIPYLKDFPEPPYKDRLPYISVYLRARLPDVSPAPSVAEDRNHLAQGWSCDTLYEAIHVMLYLDLMDGAELRKCGLRDCPRYFRPGAHDAKFCCDEHTNIATTRRSRGQDP